MRIATKIAFITLCAVTLGGCVEEDTYYTRDVTQTDVYYTDMQPSRHHHGRRHRYSEVTQTPMAPGSTTVYTTPQVESSTTQTPPAPPSQASATTVTPAAPELTDASSVSATPAAP